MLTPFTARDRIFPSINLSKVRRLLTSYIVRCGLRANARRVSYVRS